MRTQSLTPEYVDFIPNALEDGVLYISEKFKTATHCCCCGCGTKIVTPLRETEYRLIKRGGLVSLHPSIGNWNHPCQSHYWIRDNRVIWARTLSQEEIRAGRAYDDAVKEAYFSTVKLPWWHNAGKWIKHWRDHLFS